MKEGNRSHNIASSLLDKDEESRHSQIMIVRAVNMMALHDRVELSMIAAIVQCVIVRNISLCGTILQSCTPWT